MEKDFGKRRESKGSGRGGADSFLSIKPGGFPEVPAFYIGATWIFPEESVYRLNPMINMKKITLFIVKWKKCVNFFSFSPIKKGKM
ncbi:MAG: hypothetical protein JXR72_06610 [Proteobacteria bacterium]|nr:hypothetical protein [Pseudomonadota bacterium]